MTENTNDLDYRAYIESLPPVVRALYNAAAGCRATTIAFEDELDRSHELIEELELKHAKYVTEWGALEKELGKHGYRLDDDGRLKPTRAQLPQNRR